MREEDLEILRSNMQRTIDNGIRDKADLGADGTDIRWQAWQGHAKVEVL